jgi:hypothetical protein
MQKTCTQALNAEITERESYRKKGCERERENGREGGRDADMQGEREHAGTNTDKD